MPRQPSSGDLVARFRRLVNRLQTIEDELMSRGESLLDLALQSPHSPVSARTASLLRRMDVIDAELVAIESLLPEDFVEIPDSKGAAPLSPDLNVGAGPLDLGAG